MKVRDSGMPPEDVWSGFFSPEETLRQLGLTRSAGDVVDLGCGYGTFSIAAARIVSGRVHAVDMEPEMLEVVASKARAASLRNVELVRRDFVEDGCGLPDASADAVLLFNILHAETPVALLGEARRILRHGGRALVTHWVTDRPTPRGPSLEIRPTPDQCAAWAVEAGLGVALGPVSLPPYHYGFAFHKGETS